MKMANNQSVFWEWNTSLLEYDNMLCCTFICLYTYKKFATSSNMLVTQYLAECPTGESPPVGGEYPASEGLAVCTK